MQFASYTYLWPPRPERAIPREMLGFYQKRGWIAQAKMNGTCNVLAVAPDKSLKCMSRHQDEHKLWKPTEASSAAFEALPGKGWYVFVAELLHSKVEGLRDTNFVHDVLVNDGEYLVGKTFVERQNILRSLFLKGGEAETESHVVVTPHTWLAKNRLANFDAFYDSLDKVEHEGIVLKDPNAPLVLCSRQGANANWQVKSRRQHKNYSF